MCVTIFLCLYSLVVNCPDPPEIEDGEILSHGRVVYNTAVRYKCIHGSLEGSDKLVCRADGTYDKEPPQCKHISLFNCSFAW